MKKIAFVFLVFLTAPLFASQQLPYNPQGLYVDSVEKALQLNDDDIDLATAVLLVSKRWDPSINIDNYRGRIDEMAITVLDRLKGRSPSANSRQTIEIINKLLFDELGFSPVDNADNPQDLFLSSVLDSKKGYCLSLSILYLAIAERLELPVYGVVAPGHFFVRYADKNKPFNIETTQKGVSPPDEHYIKEFKIPQDKPQAIYLRNLSKKETIGCFFNNLANVYFDLNDIENAYYYQQKAVDINPLLAEARTNLGNILLKKDMVDAAIQQYQAAIKINSSDAKTFHNLANACSKSQMFDDAVRYYNIALGLDPNFIEIYKGLAQAYRSKGLTDKAISILRKAIDINSHDADLYMSIAGIYQEQQNYSEAISNYRLALAFKNDSVPAAYGLAYSYLQNQMYNDAIEQFRTVLFYEPANAKAHFGLGLTYNKLGWIEDEIASYQNALRVDANMTSAWLNLAQVYMNQKEYALAIKAYLRVIDREPSADVFYNLGVAHSVQKNYIEAAKYYLKAVELQPNYPAAHNNLAITFYMLSQYKQSLKHAEIAKEQGYEVSSDLLEQLHKNLDVKVEN
ncbi:MAG: tetratricopeptide repeat protein [Phycisphaerae bacterium]|nr:tetratricopeptide repeat protein [Phycisphaerae bacterium]